MTQVTGTGIKNVAGDIAATGTVTISSEPRSSATGGYIDGRAKKASITAGTMTALEVEPGPVKVAVAVGSSYDTFKAVVPEDGPVTLADLKEQTYVYEPVVIGQVQQLVAQVEGLSTAQDEAVADLVAPGTETKAALDATYAPAFADTGITYNPDDSVATVTENGITTSYTYNPDGTVATDTRDGVTREYTYTDGNLTGIEAV